MWRRKTDRSMTLFGEHFVEITTKKYSNILLGYDLNVKYKNIYQSKTKRNSARKGRDLKAFLTLKLELNQILINLVM